MNKLTKTLATLGFGIMALTAVGCQSTVGGQTLPSAFFLDDDVQYFPAGPEFKLTNQVRRLEEYKLQRQQFQQDIDNEQP